MIPFQVKNAMEYGVKGMLLYGDPLDFAQEGTYNVYPNKWWLPKSGIIRESVLMVPGDPQTPGWPSLGQKVHKNKKDDLMPKIDQEPQLIGFSVPNIPVQPIGYEFAREILMRLGNLQKDLDYLVPMTIYPLHIGYQFRVPFMIHGHEGPNPSRIATCFFKILNTKLIIVV